MTDSADGNLQLVLSQLLSTQQAIATDISSMREQMSKVAVHLERVDTRNESADKLHDDHEKRLRTLEAFRWKLTGMTVVVSAIGGYAGYLAGHLH